MKKLPYVALSATFFDDPDIDAAGPMPTLLYLQMACRVRQLRSDGFIHEVHVKRLGFPKWQTHIRTLVSVGLVTEHTDANGSPAWYLPAYLKWNPPEESYLRKSHEGTLWACKGRHGGEPPCDRDKCQEAAAWLSTHPTPAPTP